MLLQVTNGTRLPDEILVVYSRGISLDTHSSNNQNYSVESDLVGYLKNFGIDLKILTVEHAFPGSARNIGVEHSTGDLIGFLDVKTIPTQNWLESACNILEKSGAHGVWGARIHSSDSFFSALVLDVIYGRNAVRSVAGTVFHRKCWLVLGQMIPWAPAGEDGDWIHRIKAHKLNFVSPSQPNTIYEGLHGRNLSFFIKKWWLYYHYSKMLSINNRDRWLVHIFGYCLVIFIAFNWNYKISEFIFGTSIIVPHITKTILLGGPVLYIVLRGILIPLTRGVALTNVLPFRFIFLIVVAFILDSVKAIALLMPLKKN